jgi:hypothetical protein
MTDAFPLIFFAIMSLLIVVWFILHRRILKVLARDYASEFPRSHTRSVFEQGAMLQFFFVCDFLIKKDYLRIGNGAITATSRILKVLFALIVIAFFGMMISPMFLELSRK